MNDLCFKLKQVITNYPLETIIFSIFTIYIILPLANCIRPKKLNAVRTHSVSSSTPLVSEQLNTNIPERVHVVKNEDLVV